ncbi:hypothetical protein E2C06_14965 [Dankookia rubra]|uniref:DUF4286 family protein n=1 Tax=Dankookia rubra TaxID=1442381 RepID=A0A4R5QF20_9PROT|nr:hypothetical protein [Dankookia rubra]TDH61832.1 hypothetical protein E2C06_14965 [Dankookia rubra]
MTTTWLMVRAVLADAADIPRFDAWYAAEHLPDAKRAFGALRARCCWSRTDARVHCAFYEFPDAPAAEAAIASPALRALVAEFDRVWGTRVTRTRELLELAGEA